MLTLETITKETLWVAKVGGCRFTGTYDEVMGYFDDLDFRDVDFVCTEGQPEHLRDFYEGYFNQREYYILTDYYNNVYAKGV